MNTLQQQRESQRLRYRTDQPYREHIRAYKKKYRMLHPEVHLKNWVNFIAAFVEWSESHEMESLADYLGVEPLPRNPSVFPMSFLELTEREGIEVWKSTSRHSFWIDTFQYRDR